MDGDYGLLLCDFNTTMNSVKDRLRCTTDSLGKSRYVMRTWEESEELIDTFKLHNPDINIYTWRPKDSQKGSRLDITIATPAILPFIANFSHRNHGYDVSDHSSTAFTLDFERSEKAPGSLL